MPNITCTFSHLSVAFDHQPLFSSLSATLTRTITGLVGGNGQGKSVLIKLLANRLTPSSGSVKWFCPYYYVDQTQRLSGERIADALGVTTLYDCFSRIEQGQGSASDLEQVADLWHLPASWQHLLTSAKLNVSLDDKVSLLSGGQQTRLVLCAAFLHSDNYLLLDEPTNHLDSEGRAWLLECLTKHSGGALIVSHDRTLLRQVNTVFELSSQGLTEYGGNYDFYYARKSADIAAMERKVKTVAKEIRHNKLQQQTSLERAEQRRKQGEKLRKSGSQSKLLLDKKKESAQQSLSQLKQQQQHQTTLLSERLKETKLHLEQIKEQNLTLTSQSSRGGLRLYLSELVLPWIKQSPISASFYSGERWHIKGSNGSGKSTLLKVINGSVAPLSGICQVHGSFLYLDQHMSLLNQNLSAVDNLHQLHPQVTIADWRTRLAGVRLKGDKALQPISSLSGGEQLKVALLAVIGGKFTPDLLLLDEPENHLDLDSRLLLEQVLHDYAGTLILVSHDKEFVKNVGVNNELELVSK